MLADHHEIIREGLRTNGGKEVGTQGDAFFATFTSPRACVASAGAMQENRDLRESKDSADFGGGRDPYARAF